MKRRFLQVVIALLLTIPVCAQITEQQKINYVKNAWELTDLTDDVISQTLNTSYSGIPFKDFVSYFIAAPDILNPLAGGDYKTAGKKAADFAAEQIISQLLEQAGLSGVAAPARLAAWPIEHSLNAFYQAVAYASFKQQMALYFEAREFNSFSAIVNLQPFDLLDGVSISKSGEGWLFKNLSYLYGAVPNYTPAQFFEYAELMWQANQARANYNADEGAIKDAFRTAAAPQRPVITQQPQDAVIASGGNATFTVVVSGTGPFTYVWRFNGTVLPTEVAATLTANSAGQYQVEVSNGAGTTPSRFATLTVNSGEAVTITAPAPAATLAGSVMVRATAASATKMEFYLDGVRQYTDSAAPFAWTWNTAVAANGSRALTAKAYNGATLLGTSAAVNVTVNNTAPPTCSDPNEPNDSSLAGTPLALGSATNGYICTANDVDWFKITVTNTGVLNLNLSVPAGRDFDLELYGPSATWLAGSYLSGGFPESIQQTVSVPGTYYFRVYGYPVGAGDSDATNPYTISATFTAPPTNTTPAGQITNNVTWSGTVNLTGDITVAPGGSLTIQPGTLVRCHAGGDSQNTGVDASRVELILNGGTLNAAGTSGSPIVFTSDAVSKSPGDWYGIRLVQGSVSLQNFVIEHAVNGLRLEDNDTRFDSYLVEHGVIRNCQSYGLYQYGSQGIVELNDLTVTNNNSGLHTEGPLLVRDSRINRNTSAGIEGNQSSLTLTNCDVSTNGGWGLYVNYGQLVVRNSQFRRNGYAGVYASRPSPITFVGNTVSQNSSQGLVLDFNGGSVSAEGITGNVISNNDVGVVVYGNSVPAVTLSGNDILQNLSYELRNDSSIPITATNNYWSEPTSTELQQGQVNLSRIYDQRDNGSLGLVTVAPARFAPIGQPVGTAPTITQQPQSRNVLVGSTVTFTVAATGTTPFNYQWRKNGNPISGAQSSTLALVNVQTGDAGTYSVVVGNGAGSVTSSNATLTVTPAPANLAVRTIARTGDVFTVSLAVSPPAGAGIGFVQEVLPVGFTASGVSTGGTYNASTGTILWGPLADNQIHTLGYTLSPPLGFQDIATLIGTAYFYGTGNAVTGDSVIDMRPPDTRPRLTLTRVAGYFAVSIEGEVGRTCRVEARESLGSGVWETLATFTLNQSPKLYIDVDSLGRPQRFYRAVLLP